MAFGSKQEDKATAASAKLAQKAAQEAEKARQAFLLSPVGQASTARDQGQGFFEIQLQVGSSQRDSTVFGGNNTNISRTSTTPHTGTLAAIEAVGWRLEHVGHVFVVTSESSRDKFLASGQQTAVSGITMGVYLFRAADDLRTPRRQARRPVLETGPAGSRDAASTQLPAPVRPARRDPPPRRRD